MQILFERKASAGNSRCFSFDLPSTSCHGSYSNVQCTVLLQFAHVKVDSTY